jgi:hypothetical protein
VDGTNEEAQRDLRVRAGNLTLQENRSMATKPFRLTKVSISSLDVLGDEIVH